MPGRSTFPRNNWSSTNGVVKKSSAASKCAPNSNAESSTKDSNNNKRQLHGPDMPKKNNTGSEPPTAITSISRYNSVGSIRSIDSISILSAEALNFHLNLDDVYETDGLQPAQVNAKTSLPKPELLQQRSSNWRTRAKLVLPHVGLVLLSCVYTVLGAVTFYFIEHPNEVNKKARGVEEILRTKNLITARLWNLSREENTTEFGWQEVVGEDLDDFMKVIFEAYSKNFVTAKDVYSNETGAMWTFSASLFFSATVITTIGYGHLVPHTVTGRVLCVLFGLLGIPLILVTVADMGKFLSEYVVGFYIRSSRCFAWIRKRIFNCICRSTGLTEDGHMGMGDGSEKSVDSEFHEFELEEPKVPVTFILAILIGYTCFGALLLRTWEDWSFLDSFYYCFITVTTIGFGDIVPQKRSFILITLLYIVTGLVVTTMCIDLVGSQYIRKVHYFGREIQRARCALAAMGDKVIHIGHVIRYVAFLQKRYGLTEEQLERMSHIPDAYLLECLMSGRPLPAHLRGLFLRPFVPHEIHTLKWIDQRATNSWTSERALASLESSEVASRASARTPRDFSFWENYNSKEPLSSSIGKS